MELQKGTCLLCEKAKVITVSHLVKACKIICSSFSTKILNIAEFNKVKSSMKFCPMCYHKLIILKRINENIGVCNIKNEYSNTNCFLCKCEQNLFQVNSWPYFNEISEDLNLQKKDYVACCKCLFYLEIRQEVKTKLFSQYPRLKMKTSTGRKYKSKEKLTFASEVILHSSRLMQNKESLKNEKALSEIIDITSESDDITSVKKASINLDTLKKLKPLKHNKTFRGHRMVKSDLKFSNQIPYVLLNVSHFSNVRVNNKSFLCDESVTSQSLNISKELKKHDITKHLVVNLPKIFPLKDNLKSLKNDSPDLKMEKKTMENLIPTALQGVTELSGETETGENKNNSVLFVGDTTNEYNQHESKTNSYINEPNISGKIIMQNEIETSERSEADGTPQKINPNSQGKSESEPDSEMSMKEKNELKTRNKVINEKGQFKRISSISGKRSNSMEIDSESNDTHTDDTGYEKSCKKLKKRRFTNVDLDAEINMIEKRSSDQQTESGCNDLTEKVDYEQAANVNKDTPTDVNESCQKSDTDFHEDGSDTVNNENEKNDTEPLLEINISDTDLSLKSVVNTEKEELCDSDLINENSNNKLISPKPEQLLLENKEQLLKMSDDRSLAKSNSSIFEKTEKDDVNDSIHLIEGNEDKALSGNSEVLQFVEQYLNEKNEDIIRNKTSIQTIESCLNNDELTRVDEDNETGEEISEQNKAVSEKSTLIDSTDSNSFTGSDKNEDIGISEVDKDNINSILSDIFLQQDLGDCEDKMSVKKNDSDKSGDSEEDTNYFTKRKTTDDDLNICTDKKKKKVTFCEDLK